MINSNTNTNTNDYNDSKEYRNKWWKILEIMNQIQKENIELNSEQIEYLIIDYNVLSFLAIKEILQYSKNYDSACANSGLDCKDILLGNFLFYIKNKYNLEEIFFIEIYNKLSNISENNVSPELLTGIFQDDNWKLNILVGINPYKNSDHNQYNNYKISNTTKSSKLDDSIENYIL